MSATVHAVYAGIVGTIDALSRVRSGASSDEGSRQRLAIDRAQALLRSALRELSETYAQEAERPENEVRLMGSALVSPAASPGVDLTFTAFLSNTTSAAARAQAPSGAMRGAPTIPRSGGFIPS